MIQTLQLVNEYDDEKIYAALCRSFDALGIENDIHPGMRVVIKPNMIIAKNTSVPATTHPAVVKAAARWLTDHGVTDITLAESSGGPYNAEYMKVVYRVCGMEPLKSVLKLNNDFSAQTVDTADGFVNRSFHIITPIVKADYIINICKMKTHSMTGYSGGIKNLFGVIPGLEKPQMHYRWPDIEDFSRMLLELARTVNPQLTVIDAIDAMEGNGPTGGTSHPMHMLLAARDFYTQDCFAAKLMGIDPKSIVMLRQATEQNLTDTENITLFGDSVPDNLTPFVRPDTLRLDFGDMLPRFIAKPFFFAASRILKSYPQLKPNTCVGCGKCAESCPSHIIKIKNGKAVFRKKGCISCFCCQEMCPKKAIRVKKAL